MKVAILFSGGKDSNYAMYLASKYHKISCLISMKSKNKNSYMFQSPGLDFIESQAECLEIPLYIHQTEGEKEKELEDLKLAIKIVKEKYNIKGVVSGAIKSTYQASRIQKICKELDLFSINPLWQIEEEEFIEKLINKKFQVKIIGIAGYPLDNSYLNKNYDEQIFEKLKKINKKIGLSIAGEGGELETFVCDSPLFKKKIEIEEFENIMDSENSGQTIIKKIKLINKNKEQKKVIENK